MKISSKWSCWRIINAWFLSTKMEDKNQWECKLTQFQLENFIYLEIEVTLFLSFCHLSHVANCHLSVQSNVLK